MFDPRRLTADEPPFFALHNVKIEEDGTALWISAHNGDPIPAARVSISYSLFSGGTAGSRPRFAFGTREELEAMDADVKVVIAVKEGDAA